MVFYNFLTTDTNESPYLAFEVHMIDNKGNKWTEPNYDGCGIFCDKDIFVLIAEMNNKHTREEGYELFIQKKNGTIFPNLYRYYNESIQWTDLCLHSNKNQYNNYYNNCNNCNNCNDDCNCNCNYCDCCNDCEDNDETKTESESESESESENYNDD